MNLVKKFHDYELTLTVITPVHIGNGDSITNLNSVDEGAYIYVFDFDNLSSLANAKGFINLNKVAKQKQIINEKIYEYKIANPSKEYANERDFYIRDGNGNPYIPGSSLKGCILSAFFRQSEIGPNDNHKNFAFSRDSYVSVGDALTTEKNCTTMYRLSNKSRYKSTAKPSRFPPMRNKPPEKFLNPCEMLNEDTQFTCILRTQKLTPRHLMEAMTNHYMKHARFTNMEPNFQKYLRQEKEKHGYDFIMPLGQHKGREFNLEDTYYDPRLSQTKEIFERKEEGEFKHKQAELKREINKYGLAIKRRALPKNIPIGWVGVHIKEK